MKWFNENRKRIYLAGVAVFTIGSFAGFGNYFMSESPFNAAITVNDRKIPYKRFDRLYQRVLEDQRQKAPTPLTDEQREYIKRGIVQSLVQEEVFVMTGEALGLRVTDAELAQVIQHIPAFMKDGNFDPRTYQDILARAGIRIEDFEADQRRQLMAQKAQFTLASGVKISSLELPGKIQQALSQASEEDRKKMLENPEALKESIRNQEIQAALQEWYADQSNRLKIKVQLSKIEGTPKPKAPVPPPTPTPAKP